MSNMTHSIQHHLTDDILLGYSAGTLPEAFNILVAAHVSMCDSCRAKLESFDAIGGALLDSPEVEGVTMSVEGLEATLEKIASGVRAEKSKSQPQANPAFGASRTIPAPVMDYIGTDLSAVKWKPVGMGVKQAILSTSREATARLLYIPAGVAMPDHGHNGTELTMVLQGAFQDQDEYFGRGDVETADAHVSHTPVADIHEDCVCLAVTDAPLVFSGLIPRIMQRFVRI